MTYATLLNCKSLEAVFFCLKYFREGFWVSIWWCQVGIVFVNEKVFQFSKEKILNVQNTLVSVCFVQVRSLDIIGDITTGLEEKTLSVKEILIEKVFYFVFLTDFWHEWSSDKKSSVLSVFVKVADWCRLNKTYWL